MTVWPVPRCSQIWHPLHLSGHPGRFDTFVHSNFVVGTPSVPIHMDCGPLKLLSSILRIVFIQNVKPYI